MKTDSPAPSKSSFSIVTFFQMFFAALLLVCTFFGLYIGMRVLNFIKQENSHPSSIARQWSETGFEQLQQMSSTIKQELDLIIEQRHENQELQNKIQELNTALAKNTEAKGTTNEIQKK